MTETGTAAHRPVALWLFAIAALIAVMVTVGGATRLTDSGLSIVEWDLVVGTLPPLSEAAWQEALEEYRQIPEYQQVNRGMSLAAFKEIYWWEWGHRNLGRLIGLAFLIPLAWWSLRGRVTGGLRWRLWGLFALIGLQGVIGWFMVASGLSERVDVSQYRLALHLGTAFLLFALIVWQAIALVRPGGAWPLPARQRFWPSLLLGAISVQIILGAFVAGLRAGKTYNSWPLMDGRFFPAGYWGTPPHASGLFETIEAVQFNHRLGAYVVFALAIAFALAVWRQGGVVRRYGVIVAAAVTLQALVGIWTLVAAVPLWLGLIHQLGALGVLTVLVLLAYDVTPRAVSRAGSAAHPDSAPRAA